LTEERFYSFRFGGIASKFRRKRAAATYLEGYRSSASEILMLRVKRGRDGVRIQKESGIGFQDHRVTFGRREKRGFPFSCGAIPRGKGARPVLFLKRQPEGEAEEGKGLHG